MDESPRKRALQHIIGDALKNVKVVKSTRKVSKATDAQSGQVNISINCQYFVIRENHQKPGRR